MEGKIDLENNNAKELLKDWEEPKAFDKIGYARPLGGFYMEFFYYILGTIIQLAIYPFILSFMYPGFLKKLVAEGGGAFQPTPVLLLVFAIILEMPIAMIVLSRVLKRGANRWANIIASVITIAFVIGGGSAYPHYIFFAAIEVLCMLIIIWYAWKWPK